MIISENSFFSFMRNNAALSNRADQYIDHNSRSLRIDTLVRLRWLAVIGQSAAVLTTYFGLGFSAPILACMVVISASIWLNIGLRLWLGVNYRLPDLPAFAMLAYDVLQLSLLLFLTGGLNNPFAMLFLAPVMISAVSLPTRLTYGIGILTALASGLLVFYHYPLPWYAQAPLVLPFLYSAGIWLAIIIGAAFTGIYAGRVALEARQLSGALAATELVLTREQHLTQLDGLAAAAAHELGTPLATITLVVKEMGKLVPHDTPLGEDVSLLVQEVARCRAILGKIASLGSNGGDLLSQMSLAQLLEEVADPHRHFGISVTIEMSGKGGEPGCRRNPGILYGLGNLIENAVDFASSHVRISASWDAASVSLVIEDDGPGFSPDILGRLGEPYVTAYQPKRKAKSGETAGLGLGLFIAKTLLERSGAKVITTNVRPPDTGAFVMVRWPRNLFERRPQPARDDIR